MGSQSYLVFSFRGQDYLALPAGSSPLRRRGIELYKENSLRRWLFKAGIRLATIARIEGLLARVAPTPVPKYPNFDFDAWLDRVRQELGCPEAQAVVSFPGQSNRGRFYVNLVSPRAEALAFGKISLDEKNDRHLQTEAKTLRYLAAQDIRSFRVPKVLVEGTFNSHRHLITEAIPAEARPVPAKWEPVPQRCRDELLRISLHQGRLGELSWWGSFNDKAQEVTPLAEAIEANEDRMVEVYCAHGDFTRRNISSIDNQVWVFDWENSSPDAPLMADEVRFFLSLHGRQIVSNPAEVAASLGQRYLERADATAKRDLALALAFLSTCTTSAAICARNWSRIIRYCDG